MIHIYEPTNRIGIKNERCKCQGALVQGFGLGVVSQIVPLSCFLHFQNGILPTLLLGDRFLLHLNNLEREHPVLINLQKRDTPPIAGASKFQIPVGNLSTFNSVPS